MRMPEPIPFGLTSLRAMIRATVRASLLKVPSGGNVETVFTSPTQRWLCFAFFMSALTNADVSLRGPIESPNQLFFLQTICRAQAKHVWEFHLSVLCERDSVSRYSQVG